MLNVSLKEAKRVDVNTVGGSLEASTDLKKPSKVTIPVRIMISE